MKPAAEQAPLHDPSCQDDYDPGSLPIAAAAERIMSTVAPVADTETLPLRAALGRVLAQTVNSTINVPGHANSAMDGYALRLRDLPRSGAGEFKVVGKALAGRPYAGGVGAGECVRIMTGAVLPADCDTVVIQEQAEASGGGVRIGGGHRKGQNVRLAGEDVAAGEKVLDAGRRLSPADVGLLASVGATEATVTRPLKVAFFSTGSELRPAGEPLAAGQIYDSNRYTLFGMLTRLGVEISDLGIVADDRAALIEAFGRATAADAVITSGGVSVGEADYVKEILAQLGRVHFWKVAVKPGRPLAFGRIGDTAYFGLPGNPVSVMVTFYVLVQPALKAMMGETHQAAALRLRARSLDKLRKRPGRVEFQRGILERGEDGEYNVRKTGAQGSGILSSMTAANCLIILGTEEKEIAPGAAVEVIPFDSLT